MYYSQVPYSIDISSNNPNKVLLWSSLNGITYIPSQGLTENITLYVEDANLKQTFDFNFNLPKSKVDSVFYAFMNNYTRNSYNSVTADFSIFELYTPLEYNGSFDKYMIYDEDGKFFVPMRGVFVKAYTGSCSNGGTFNISSTTDIQQVGGCVDSILAQTFWGNFFTIQLTDNFVNPATNMRDIALNSLQSLGRHCLNNLSQGILSIIGLKPGQEITASTLKKLLYYGNFIIYNGTEFDGTSYFRIHDIAFATGNVYSYQSSYSSKVFEHDYYNLIKNTIRRDSSKWQLSEGEYLVTKVDGQNVSSLLPNGTDTTYLNSPVFRNTDSINGGYLIAYVEDIINGDKVVNYNNDYSPIYNGFNESYLNNFDDSIQNSENEDYIDSTDSDSKLIQKFLSYIKSIDDKLDNLKTNAENTINNTTTSIVNVFTIDKMQLKDATDDFIDTFNDSMGIIADIPTMLLYFLGRFVNLNNGDISLVIPTLAIFDTTLLPETTINFTTLINSDPTFTYLHNITLICSDVLLLAILLQLAKNAFEEVKK